MNRRETYPTYAAALERRRAVIEAGYKCSITIASDDPDVVVIISLGTRHIDYRALPARTNTRRI
jgi:hypothetical protein